MDFSNIDTAGACEDGAWMDILAPCDLTLPSGVKIKAGEVMDDGSGPPRLKVLGSQSQAFRREMHRLKRKAFEDAGKFKDDPDKMPDSDSYTFPASAVLVIDQENYLVKGEPLKCTPENVLREFERNPWLQEQVDRFAGRLSNYLGEPSRPSRASSNATPGARRKATRKR